MQKGFFVKGVLTRFEFWIKGLPEDKRELAFKIALMAGQQYAGTGADVNGVALDQLCKPSLESLVLHYAKEEDDLFPIEALMSITEKLKGHQGPKYKGPWP